MNLSPEDKKIGQENFHNAVGGGVDLDRRQFIKGTVAAGIIGGGSLGAMYFNYSKVDKPVRIGIIGTGDEGSVLIGALTPSYIEVAAIADIRPYNVHRAFHGDWSSPTAIKVRPGLMAKYGWKTEEAAKDNVKVYSDYKDLLKDKDKLGIEGVIIALPLHLHAPAAIEAMNAGLHVLTEKLMGYTVADCKDMGRVSEQTNKLLATGHQRHYSVLYDNAVDCIRQGLIGDIHHIRAQWHRGNLPGKDSWQPPLPGDKKLLDLLAKTKAELKSLVKPDPKDLEKLQKLVVQYEQQATDSVAAETFGYQSKKLAGGYEYSPLEELIRWRLWERTGGGLMAELGSHQLDAAGIYISAMDPDKQKALPLTVSAVGGRSIFPMDRECEDHVYCMYEFPAPGYFKEGSKTEVKDRDRKVVVTYSSINGNGFGDYGEVVMGTKGTLVVLQEKDAMLYKNSDTKTTVGVKKDKSGAAVLDTTESGSSAAAIGKLAVEAPSRGYTEEIEHWAWCIRNPSAENQPKCKPSVALGDAVIALTTNIALRDPTKSRIEFDPKWFDINDDATPDDKKPSVKVS